VAYIDQRHHLADPRSDELLKKVYLRDGDINFDQAAVLREYRKLVRKYHLMFHGEGGANPFATSIQVHMLGMRTDPHSPHPVHGILPLARISSFSGGVNQNEKAAEYYEHVDFCAEFMGDEGEYFLFYYFTLIFYVFILFQFSLPYLCAKRLLSIISLGVVRQDQSRSTSQVFVVLFILFTSCSL
jgi:hypothetical protein